MSDQIRISDSGELETVPTTWDGEPLYSPSTVAEGLFDADAFVEQQPMLGQTNWTIVVCSCCLHDFHTYPDQPEVYCPSCMELGR